MKALASIFLIASTVLAAALAEQQAMPQSQSTPAPSTQIAALGQKCVTSGGSCPVPPRPVGTQCFCGTVRGEVK